MSAPPGTASLRRVRRQVSNEVRFLDAAVVRALGLEIVGRGPAWVGYEIIASHAAAFAGLDRSAIERLGAGMSDWGQVDAFATIVAGPAWQVGLLADDAVMDWARSPDRWWRRAALAATVPLNAASTGSGDAARTLAVCRTLVGDRDDMVIKAMSWALRTLSARDRIAVEAFLAEHSDRLAPRVRREVRNKLETGLKTPRRAENKRRG